MRKEAIILLVVLLVLASGVVGYLVGAASQSAANTTTSPPPMQLPRVLLAASCSPAGTTGAIIAANTGTIPVNLTEVTISDSSGIHIAATFQHGIVVNSGNYTTLSQGIAYSGSNATIGAVSEYGTVFTTSCHA
jgi:hypothetical protein